MYVHEPEELDKLNTNCSAVLFPNFLGHDLENII